MTCRTCKWLDVRPDKDGKRRVRKNNGYRCIVQVAAPKWPDSVTKAHGYYYSPARTFMSPDEGENCPTKEKRV